ncbi:MAG: sensor histidine kinase [Bryobacteraceae bacterium]
MNRLRNRLILVFLAATLIPLGVTLWITTSLLEQSLSLSSPRKLELLTESLELTGRALYQRTGELLEAEAESGKTTPKRYAAQQRSEWPQPVRDFFAGGEQERFELAGEKGELLHYLVRRGGDVLVWSKPLGEAGMKELRAQIASARSVSERAATRDFRKGFLYTLVLLSAITWFVSLVALVFWAHKISDPIQKLTAGLSELAAGNLNARLEARRNDEIGAAMQAFNHTAEQLQQSRERLVYVTRLASWQTLARKMAHEVKNSLTPIRLTMEELVARRHEPVDHFLEQAAQIVVDEVSSLERRVRAFSEFAAEPPIRLGPIDLNALVEERISFLKTAHPGITYNVQRFPQMPSVRADQDLVNGVLTNLLENAAQAAGAGGVVLAKTLLCGSRAAVEIHDSGPGLSPHARGSLFEPTISFKKAGMGLGLSIARRSVLLMGGDISLVDGELGGAAFRISLPLGPDTPGAPAPPAVEEFEICQRSES